MCIRDRPEGWADLAFADPPFNIGYLYHGYDDRLKTEDYLCLLYTSDAADERSSVDLGGRRIIKKKNTEKTR